MQNTTRPGLKLGALVGLALGIAGYFVFAAKLDPIHYRHDGFAHSWGLVFLLSALAGTAGLVVTLVIAARSSGARSRQFVQPGAHPARD